MEAIDDIDNWQSCAKKCSEESGCSFWTWVTPDHEDPSLRLACFLKNSDAGRNPLEGVMSGAVSCGDTNATTTDPPSEEPTDSTSDDTTEPTSNDPTEPTSDDTTDSTSDDPTEPTSDGTTES